VRFDSDPLSSSAEPSYTRARCYIEVKNRTSKGVRYQDPSVDARRQRLFQSAYLYFRSLPEGSHIFCEEPLALTSGKTTRILGMVVGAIWSAHLSCSVFWHWVNVSTWQGMVGANTGKSEQRKAKVQTWALEHGADEGWDEDHYDAFCIGRYGMDELLKVAN
jgi:hypothetical protein